jgi:hypothetical protein
MRGNLARHAEQVSIEKKVAPVTSVSRICPERLVAACQRVLFRQRRSVLIRPFDFSENFRSQYLE